MDSGIPDLDALPELPPRQTLSDYRRELSMTAAECRIVVLDDDPLGTQTVADIPVFLDWQHALARIPALDAPLLFLSTNSRSLDGASARALSHDITRGLLSLPGANRLRIVSRCDSTLRGHFPDEPLGILEAFDQPVDGIILCFALFEGGRITVEDQHFLQRGAELLPVSRTEFARDSRFGFHSSHLPTWIRERYPRSPEPVSISIEDLRLDGSTGALRKLMTTRDEQPVIVNAVSYDDLILFCRALTEAEQNGRRYIYRCAASFILARVGAVEPAPSPVSGIPGQAAIGAGPGMVVAGSVTETTARQLEYLLSQPGTRGIEIPLEILQKPEPGSLAAIAAMCDQVLRAGITPVLFTDRRCVELPDAAAGNGLVRNLAEIISAMTERPSFHIFKGGNTAYHLLRYGLRASSATVLGQLIPGVPLWQLEDRGGHRPLCILFPGNLGNPNDLALAWFRISRTGA